MLDCLATIKATISFLQKLSAEQNLVHEKVLDQLTLSPNQTQTIADQSDCQKESFDHNNATSQEAVKPLKDLLMEMLLDLCAVMFDGMYLTWKPCFYIYLQIYITL